MSSATSTTTTVLHTNTYCVEVSAVAVFCLDDNTCTREVPTNMYALYALYWY